jgi:bifunctional polynucleotide phosphatase/kinase
MVDDMNADRYTRRDYVDLAKRLRVQVRCVYFEGTIEHAWHNNVYRTHCTSDAAQLGPVCCVLVCKKCVLNYFQEATQTTHPSVFKKFKATFESPAEKVTAEGSLRTEDVSWKLEGFNSLTTIYWKFDGTDEQFKRYMMWLFKLPA